MDALTASGNKISPLSTSPRTVASTSPRVNPSPEKLIEAIDSQNLVDSRKAARDDERIRLNVGGTRYETYRSTLAKYPETLLGTMFGDRNRQLVKPDTDGEYFFDRNPIIFQVVLDFYRTGKILPPTGITFSMLKAEFDFFQISTDGKLLTLDADDLDPTTKFGDRMRKLSLRRAYQSHKIVLDRLLNLVFESVLKASEAGCRFCNIDMLKGHSYLRQSQGKDEDSGYWRANIVDKEICSFLKEPNHRWLFAQKLRTENFQFTFQPIQSTTSSKNFSLSICLWGIAKQNEDSF